MSMNITPHIPQVIANAAAPNTEALANANALKQTIPAPTQVEAMVPQKSREQDARPPGQSSQSSSTYEDIYHNRHNRDVIPEDDTRGDGEQPSEQNEQQQTQQESANAADQNENAEQQQSEQKAQQRVEEAQQRVELQQIRKLERRDAEVRAHEQAHAAVGGAYAGSPSYEYETGPNGKKYAVGGEVPIDVSSAGDAQETIQKMQTVRAAALAPAEPSSQDRKVAAEATRKITEARQELVRESLNFDKETDTKSAEALQTEQKRDNDNDSLATQTGDEPIQGANQADPLQQPEQGFSELGMASLAKERQESKTAYVVSGRYHNSYQTIEQSFSAVA